MLNLEGKFKKHKDMVKKKKKNNQDLRQSKN